MRILPEEMVVYRGRAAQIAYARDAAGRLPAREFLENETSEKDQAALYRVIERLAESGKVSNREKFKKLDGEIWEIKSFQLRIGAFRLRSVWYLTHGFQKKRDKWPKAQIERAERIRQEHLAWLNRRSQP